MPNSEKDVRLKLNLNFCFIVLIFRSSGSRKKSKGKGGESLYYLLFYSHFYLSLLNTVC